MFFTVFFILAFKPDYFKKKKKKKKSGNGSNFYHLYCLLVWGVLFILEVDQGFISSRLFVVLPRPVHGSIPIASSSSSF